jgi:hypothetical protein
MAWRARLALWVPRARYLRLMWDRSYSQLDTGGRLRRAEPMMQYESLRLRSMIILHGSRRAVEIATSLS